jgi:Holliday junction resolvasome RuvABC endonuclease subunit
MPHYIGVDPAAARLDAVIVFSDGTWQIEQRTMPTDMVDRCDVAERWMRRVVKETAAWGGKVVVGVEEPVLGRAGRAGAAGTLPNAMVHGALLVGARRAGAIVLRINNMHWKKTIVGKGNAKKPEVNAFIRQTWPELWNLAKGRQDTCDAACIVQQTERSYKVRMKMARTRARAAAEQDLFAGLPKRTKR